MPKKNADNAAFLHEELGVVIVMYVLRFRAFKIMRMKRKKQTEIIKKLRIVVEFILVCYVSIGIETFFVFNE